MQLKKLLPIILIIFCVLNGTLARSRGRGRSGSHGGFGHGHSSSHGSHSSHSTHIATHSHSGVHRKKWSSSSSDEHKTSDTITVATPKPTAFEAMSFTAPTHSYKFEETSAYRTPVHLTPSVISINELDNFLSGYFTGRSLSSGLSLGNHLYSEHYQPPIVLPPSLRASYKEDDDIWKTDRDSKTASNNFESHKGHDVIWKADEDIKSASDSLQALNLNLPLAPIANSLGGPCRQLHSAGSKLVLNADSVKESCWPTTTTPSALKPTAITATQAPHAAIPKERRYERITTTTPRGINCRKVMNSELNEKGEIIDSVWEICDPPPTTTTTTRRPTTKATTKRPIITAKPLVRVCRPVMDSYLNDLGEIIDSVTEVCTMEPLK